MGLALGALGCGDDGAAELTRADPEPTSPTPPGDKPAAQTGIDAASPRSPLDSGAAPDGLRDAALPTRPVDDAGTGADAQAAASCGACAGHELCDEASHTCVDKYAPWQLDCQNLPAHGTCQGGPREVLLLTTQSGHTLMLDPHDGHYLGVFKYSNDYWEGTQQVTQGPDQCIWSVASSERAPRAIERWNSDGSFRDDVIPHGKHLRDGADRLVGAGALAFSNSHLYVAAGEDSTTAANVSRYTLEGSFDKELSSAQVSALYVANDGSWFSSGERVQHWPAEAAPPVTVLTEPSSALAYAGHGELLVAQRDDNTLYRVNIESGAASHVEVLSSFDNVYALAQLRNGRWLYSSNDSDTLFSVDPAQAGVAAGTAIYALADSGQPYLGHFGKVGRACLPDAVVERKPEVAALVPPERCDELPTGAALMNEDFEAEAFSGAGFDHSYHGWTDQSSQPPPSTLEGSEHVSGARSLRIDSKDLDVATDGVQHDFAAIKPSYMGYWAKLDGGSTGWASVLLRSDSGRSLELIELHGNRVEANSATRSFTVPSASWVRIQLRNIDWAKRSYDLYVNCARVAENLRLSAESGDEISSIDLFVDTYEAARSAAYFDDIVLR
jgi:hypothetical protein